MVEKILNNTTPYGKIRASHEGSLHSNYMQGKTCAYIATFSGWLYAIGHSWYKLHFEVIFLRYLLQFF